MVKRVKLNKKRVAFLCCLLIISVFLIASWGKITSFYRFVRKGYNFEEIREIDQRLNDEEKELLNSYGYFSDLLNLLDEKYFQPTNFKQYLEYLKRYEDYDSNFIKIINDPYFKLDHIERYVTYYRENPNLNDREIVENVNCNLDKPYYSSDDRVDLTKGNLVLVNKYYQLESDYVPEKLVRIDNKYGYERLLFEDAYQAFISLYEAAAQEGLLIYITSPYRSYAYQRSLYEDYIEQNGQESADNISAKPGHSEHQTGLAIDVAARDHMYTKFVNTDEYQWMLKHAHEYGFILRYPEGKEKQTGYTFESWHYRYVGKEVAAYIYQHQITFDEYYEYFLK